MKTHEFIEEFIIAVQEEFPRMEMDYFYDEQEIMYFIEYNVIEYDGDKIYERMVELSDEMLVDEGIVSFDFAEVSY